MIDLWTDTRGSGVPLVLAHGGPGLSDNLAPVSAMVEDVALVHRYDQRGCGRSPRVGPYDVETFVAVRCSSIRRTWRSTTRSSGRGRRGSTPASRTSCARSRCRCS